MSGDHQDEYGVDIEIKVPEDVFEIAFVGGAQYVFRPLQDQHVFGLGYRHTIWNSDSGFSAMLGYGFGGEVAAGDPRFGLFRFQAGLVVPIPGIGSYVHVVGSAGGMPPWQHLRPNQTGRGTLEGGVFLNVPLLAKLSSPGAAVRPPSTTPTISRLVVRSAICPPCGRSALPPADGYCTSNL
jgi:hypothetical protein